MHKLVHTLSPTYKWRTPFSRLSYSNHTHPLNNNIINSKSFNTPPTSHFLFFAQLICIARAILRKPKILVLDEVRMMLGVFCKMMGVNCESEMRTWFDSSLEYLIMLEHLALSHKLMSFFCSVLARHTSPSLTLTLTLTTHCALHSTHHHRRRRLSTTRRTLWCSAW